MGKTTKTTRTAKKSTKTRESIVEPIAVARDHPETAHLVHEDGALPSLLSATEWAPAGALDAIFEAAPESITVYDTEGRIVRANATFRASLARLFPGDRPTRLHDRLAQHPLRSVRGDVLSEEEWPQTRLLHGETLTGASAAETMMYTPGGEAIYWSVTGAPVHAADGCIIGAVAIHRDITAQKRLEEERERLMLEAHEARAQAEATAARLQTVLEILPVGVSIVDVHGKPVLVNDAVRAIWGAQLPMSESVEQYQEYKAWWPQTGQRVANHEWGLARSLNAGEVVTNDEIEIETFEGQRKFILNADAPIHDAQGAITGAVSVILDMSERKQLENELAERVSLLMAIFDAVPDRLSVFDAAGEIVQLNAAAARLAEQERGRATLETIGEVLQLRTPGGDPFPAQDLPIVRALRGESVSGVEVRFRDATGREQSSLNSAAPFYDRTGQLQGAVALAHDVTSLRAAERAAGERAAQLDATFDALTDGLFVYDAAGQLTRMNEAGRALLALDAMPAFTTLSRAERAALLNVRHGNDQPLGPDEGGLSPLLQGTRHQTGFDFRITSLDGAVKDVSLTGGPIRDSQGKVIGAVTLLRDVTERRELEEEVRRSRDELETRVVERTQELAKTNRELRSLSQRILEVQETEQRRIARELHDEIGQALTGVKLMLETAQRKAAANGSNGSASEVRDYPLPDMRSAIDDALSKVRELSLDLRPAMLDSLGLLPTLLWRFENYTRQTGIHVEFHHCGLDQRFSPEVETGAYRIIQEALTNVARHAAVPLVRVQLTASDAALRIDIIDDGIGFDCESAIAAGVSTGLAGMRERATLLGGAFLISSTPGAGTTIEVELPLIESVATGQSHEVGK